MKFACELYSCMHKYCVRLICKVQFSLWLVVGRVKRRRHPPKRFNLTSLQRSPDHSHRSAVSGRSLINTTAHRWNIYIGMAARSKINRNVSRRMMSLRAARLCVVYYDVRSFTLRRGSRREDNTIFSGLLYTGWREVGHWQSEKYGEMINGSSAPDRYKPFSRRERRVGLVCGARSDKLLNDKDGYIARPGNKFTAPPCHLPST